MKKLLFIIILSAWIMPLKAQVVYNPNVAIRPIIGMSVYKVELTDTSTVVTVRLKNQNQLAPFSIRSKNLILRKSGEQDAVRLIKSKKAPFYPQKHVFSFKDEILDFVLYFPALEKPVKYIDVQEEGMDKKFFLQGIILDPDMNREIAKGFKASRIGDIDQALIHFINFAEMDMYFEYGIAYVNIIYLLAQQKRWAEAKEWYEKFQERFFYDKKLLSNQLAELGIIQHLEQGR